MTTAQRKMDGAAAARRRRRRPPNSTDDGCRRVQLTAPPEQPTAYREPIPTRCDDSKRQPAPSRLVLELADSASLRNTGRHERANSCYAESGKTSPKRRLELADIFRAGDAQYRARYGHQLTIQQDRALREIDACRTRVMGGHMRTCTDCGREKPSYNSCNNRNCPKCHEKRREDWFDRQMKNVLPVEYHPSASSG